MAWRSAATGSRRWNNRQFAARAEYCFARFYAVPAAEPETPSSASRACELSNWEISAQRMEARRTGELVAASAVRASI
jgi:hypothetical protein